MRPLFAIVAAVIVVTVFGVATGTGVAAEPPDKPAADPAVVATLGSDDPLVLRGALAELADSDPATIPADSSSRLIEIALDGTDTEARERALQVLGTMGERVSGRSRLWPRLARYLDIRRKAPPGRVRGWAAWTLGKTGAPVDDYGIVLLGAMSPYDDFSRVAALEAFLSLGGDVPRFLRKALFASPPGGIRANIIHLLGQVPVDEGGLSGAEARRLLVDAHRTERTDLISIAIDRMTGTAEERAWLVERLAGETSYFELRPILIRLTGLGPEGAYAAPSVCQLFGRDHAPQFEIYAYFAAVGPAPEAMCAIPRLAHSGDQIAAGEALLAMGDAGLAVLVKWLHDDERMSAALELLQRADPPPWPAFHAVLKATSAEHSHVRSTAARVLPIFGEVGQFHLRRMLTDDDPWVRETVLSELEGPGLQKLLLDRVSNEDVGHAAVTRLGEVKGPLGPEDVFRFVWASEVELSMKLDLAEKLNRPLLPLFESLSESDEVTDRLAATRVAIRLKETPLAAVVVPKLALMVDDPDLQVRGDSIETLESFGPAAAPAVASLRSALLDPDWSVHSRAVRALGAIGPGATEALPDLRDILDLRMDAGWALVEAIIAIGGMDDDSIDEYVGQLGSDAGSSERTRAARILGNAKGSEKARNALRTALNDPDEHVRWAAANSLATIGDTADLLRARAVLHSMGPFAPMRPMPSF